MMARRSGFRSLLLRPRTWCGVTVFLAVAAFFIAGLADVRPSIAQKAGPFSFPVRPKGPPKSNLRKPEPGAKPQMLVRASEINYDYTNERVSAVGNVQIYYSNATLDADTVIYDQKTKRLHAEGNVRLVEPDGRITYGQIMDLSDDFRDGFVDSLRLDAPDRTRFAARRADRTSGNSTIFQSGVYTACEPCKDDPKKPPKWQVKAARIIHDQGEKMLYFENAQLEFFGVPIAYMPFFSAPDPSAKRKSGFLVPTFSIGTAYGFGVTIPYYWSLAPDYDLTFSPFITSRQGPMALGEWRQRLVNGAYTIRAAGIFQLDKDYFNSIGNATAAKDFRGSVETRGQFSLNDKWVWGWDGTLVTDRAFYSDYKINERILTTNYLGSVGDHVLSQLYLVGRGDRSYFDVRTLYFYGFSSADVQQQLPVVHPVLDYDYTFGQPVLGGELSFRSNLTSLTRQQASFDPISAGALMSGVCAMTSADPAAKNLNNCLLRGVPGSYTRASVEANWRRTFIDPYGQIFTPFMSVRTDVASLHVTPDPGVSNFINTGDSQIGRIMPVVGLEYRYPFISAQSWGTHTIEPIAQLILRPNETAVSKLPNEDAQSLIFDDGNLFRVNKFSGWDRVEGGGRLNTGIQYTLQFHRGGFFNALFGQSYQLFGLNSFAAATTTNTGLDSGLDTARSDYVARMSFQPTGTLLFTSRFRFDHDDFTLQRTELEAAANFGRWNTSIMYGNYAPQPALGLLDTREGLLGTARLRVTQNWNLIGALRYDIKADRISQTQLGIGYIDDCIIFALQYSTNYSYGSTTQITHTYQFQMSLRTLGGT